MSSPSVSVVEVGSVVVVGSPVGSDGDCVVGVSVVGSSVVGPSVAGSVAVLVSVAVPVSVPEPPVVSVVAVVAG